GALAKVTAATYPETSFEGLPPELVAKYLVLSSNHGSRRARISDEIRSRVIVGSHDALRSPRLAPAEAGVASFDVVSCRNLLVYLKPDSQDALITRLLKTCMQDSLLVISDSESIRTATHGDGAPPPIAPIDTKIPVFRVT
ncbi:MAG: CheR family methyltransferase, partial [Polyangiaceae bacterium]